MELVTVDVEQLEDIDDDETEAAAAESNNNEDLEADHTGKEKEVLDMFDEERQVEELEPVEQVVTTAGDVLEEATDGVEEDIEDAPCEEMVVVEELVPVLELTLLMVSTMKLLVLMPGMVILV